MNRQYFRAIVMSAVASVASMACAIPRARAPRSAAVVNPVCVAIDPLMDLEIALSTPASFGASSDLFFLVDADQELGAIRIARTKLASAMSDDARSLDAKLDRLEASLTRRRADLAFAIATLAKTGASAEAAIESAALCRSADLRDPAKSTHGDAKARAANQETIASKGCESAVRLWSATRNVDLTSDLSSAGIAAHIGELTLAGDRAVVRDRLAVALREHAEALRKFHVSAAPKREERSENALAIMSIGADVLKQLGALDRACLETPGASDHVVGGRPEPRRATVTVRPTWSGSLAKLPHQEEFGSGFVVRWRTVGGDLETLIVTNNHVMDGAFEAEITPGDRRDASAGEEAAPPLTAKLIEANPNDDVAILRVDTASNEEAAREAFTEGVAFRMTPAREEEPVIAAGFPGIGVRPSFQVSKGSVSNAKFRADDSDTSALAEYVQHTAAIDPGNSGGPLLDANGHLLGMNTFKIVGRENVGLAIPTWRIQVALARAEHDEHDGHGDAHLDAKHAEASCNAVVASLASPHPIGDAMSRFGLALYDWSESRQSTNDAATYRAAVRGEPENPVGTARLRAYGALRAEVERERGVVPFEACSDVKPGAAIGSFVATFRTRAGSHELTFAEEHGAMRVVAFK